MDKIDRLGWTVGFAFASYGVRIGIRSNDKDLLTRIEGYLPPGWRPVASPVVQHLYSLLVGKSLRANVRRFNLLYRNTVRLARTLDLEELFDLFEADIHLRVAEHARRRVFVHAGVVGWNGRAIVIPGRSLSGKTTLVAELVRAGATFYSDEYAVLDSQGRVHPYPRPLAVREGNSLKQTRYAAETLCAEVGSKPLPVGMVVVSSYKQGAKWKPRVLSPGQGALALLDNTVSIRQAPANALPTLKNVVAAAPVLKGSRGEAVETVEFILQNLEN